MPPQSPAWDRLFADIKISLPGAADAVQQQELFRCVKDFMEQTNIWLEEVPLPVQPNKLTYTFTVAGKGMPNRLMIVYDPATSSPDKRWVMGGMSMMVPGVLQMLYAPSTATTWMVVVAKNIIDPVDANNYPELDDTAKWILDKYRDAFYYGTMARMMMQPGKTYSNTKLAAFNMQNYISQRGKARSDALAANVYGGQRWQFPQSFATTSRKGWT